MIHRQASLRSSVEQGDFITAHHIIDGIRRLSYLENAEAVVNDSQPVQPKKTISWRLKKAASKMGLTSGKVDMIRPPISPKDYER